MRYSLALLSAALLGVGAAGCDQETEYNTDPAIMEPGVDTGLDSNLDGELDADDDALDGEMDMDSETPTDVDPGDPGDGPALTPDAGTTPPEQGVNPPTEGNPTGQPEGEQPEASTPQQ